jgi:hypothetical protein
VGSGVGSGAAAVSSGGSLSSAEGSAGAPQAVSSMAISSRQAVIALDFL